MILLRFSWANWVDDDKGKQYNEKARLILHSASINIYSLNELISLYDIVDNFQ